MISACTTAMIMPMKPSSDPTERSMLRDTMIRTMPLARMAMVAVWTDRFQRLRGDRKRPLRREVEADPDDGERDQHADQANVDLGRLEEAVDRAPARALERGGRRTRGFNHCN